MRKYILAIFFLSCSHQAAPGGGGAPKPASSQAACTSDSECTVQGEFCNFLFPGPRQTGGLCMQACIPGDACTTDGNTNEFCNPISGFCETNCSTQQPSFCTENLPKGGTAICINNTYCGLQPTGANCPGNLKASGGFCKFDASKLACPPGSGQVADPITGTCELNCGSKESICTALNYTPASASTNIQFGCSPITSTCVTSCTVGQSSQCTLGTTRSSCYSRGYQSSVPGTCEKPCSSGKCSGGLSCAEGVCQPSCKSDSDCMPNPQRKRCDYISGACAVGCKDNTTCSALGLVCSPISATCVAACSPPISCPSQDTIRSGCLTVATQNLSGYNSCEVGCTGSGTKSAPSSGDCTSGAQKYYCVTNPNFVTGFVANYCGIQCIGGAGTCGGLGYSQACRVDSICSL